MCQFLLAAVIFCSITIIHVHQTESFSISHPFQCKSPSLQTRSVNTRLWIATDETNIKQKQPISSPKNKISQDVAKFRNHLQSLDSTIRDKRQRALTLDSELAVMEDRWRNRKNNNMTTTTSKKYYSGAAVPPDIACYILGAKAFARSGMGEDGAKRAELLVDRSPSPMNRPLLSLIVRAWATADKWTKAEEWLQRMRTNALIHPDNGPDVATYTSYLDELAKSRSKSSQTIAKEALALLEYMNKQDRKVTKPDALTYAAVILCVARSNDLKTIEALWKELTLSYQTTNEKILKPTPRVYAAIIGAWSKSGKGLQGAQRADALLQELRLLNDPTCCPDEYIYVSVLSAYSKVKDPTGVLVALQRTDELIHDFEQELPNSAFVYTAAMQVKINEANPNGGTEAEALLRRITSPDYFAYRIVILAYAMKDQPEHATRLLDEVDRVAEKRKEEPVNPLTVAACINSWLRSEEKNKMIHADRLVRRIGTMYKQGNVKANERHIDIWLFHAVINGWKDQKSPDAGENAEALMHVMRDDFRGTVIQRNITPSKDTYSMVLDAWMVSGHVNAGSRAMRLLHELEEKHILDPIQFPEPTSREIFPTLLAVAKSGEDGMDQVAKDLFSRLCQLRCDGDDSFDLNTRTTTSVLREFANNPSDEAGLRAVSLLQHVVDLSRSRKELFNLRPEIIEFNCVINVLVKKGFINQAENLLRGMNKEKLIKPDLRTYSSILDGFMYVEGTDTIRRAEAIFSEVLQLYKEGDLSYQPDAIIFNTMFNLLAKMGAQPGPLLKKGFALLDQMRELNVIPSSMIYSILCRMCLNDGTEAAMDLMEKMMEDAEMMIQRGQPPLSRSVYEQALTTYLYSKAKGSIDKAKALLKEMEAKSQVDRLTIHIFLAAYARSGQKESVKEAKLMLEKMKSYNSEHMKATVASHNWVLLATTTAETLTEKDKAFNFAVAVDSFKEIHTNDEMAPNHRTYDAFFKACWKLRPEGNREGLISKAFDLCIKNGCVSTDVFETLASRTPNVLNLALSKIGLSSEDDLPEEWCTNVPINKHRGIPVDTMTESNEPQLIIDSFP